MKRGSFWLALAAVSLSAGTETGAQDSSVLTVQARNKIRVLADEHSYVMDIFLSEEFDAPTVPISSIPETAKSHALAWIARIVQDRWLPADVESMLVARKDVKQWEKRDKNGILIFERIGDFLTVDYETTTHGIHLQESGASVSLRVDFPQQRPVADDPEAFIRQCLTDFLNIPQGVVSQLRGDLKQELPVYFAYLRSPRVIDRELAIRELARQTPPGQSFEINDELRARARQWQWWDRVSVCTDGRFFFVNVVEAEPGRKPRRRPGLPNRF